MWFKEGISQRVSGVSEGVAEMRVLPSGDNVTSLKVRYSGKWGSRVIELVAFNNRGETVGKAEALRDAVTEVGLRLIAVGLPRVDPWEREGKPTVIFDKLVIDELWVEDIEAKSFAEIISKNGVVEEKVRVFEPIEVPDAVRF